MSLLYPARTFGRFGLSYGLTPSLLHERYGADFGERFHRDIAWRIEQTMEIDRLAHRDFGALGIGFEEPFPRATIAPFGHRFVPAIYGCEISYSPCADPAAVHRKLDTEEIRAMEPWTEERFEAAEPVRAVLEQARWAREHCDRLEAERRLGFNPHEQPLTSLQNLGSVINTAVSAFGEGALLLGMDDPGLLRSLYGNIADLMLLCLRRFPAADGRVPHTVFVGNCTVAMISPAQYAASNLESDRRLAEFARSIGARFIVHQDSGASPHLANYASLGNVAGLDFGQDTDWEAAARRFPDAEANCILFPGWLRVRPEGEIEEELLRLMAAGARFPRFSFSVLEVDAELARGKIFEFDETFRRCAERIA